MNSVRTSHSASMGNPVVKARQPEEILLRVQGLSKAFGGQVVLDDISLELHRGEVVFLRGDNGSGKTTLLNILTGNLEPDEGTISFLTNSTKEDFCFPRSWWEFLNPFDHFSPERVARKGVGRTWQDVRLFSTQNIQENISVASQNQIGENPLWALMRRLTMWKQEKAISRAAEKILIDLGLAGRNDSSADKISLGQTKRVSIARAVNAGARVLFLDEPLAGVDESGISDVIVLLRRLAHEENVTLVVVEHQFNMPRILDLASTIWTLQEGKVVVEQSTKELKNNIPQSCLRDLLNEIKGMSEVVKNKTLPGGAILSIINSGNKSSSKKVLELENVVVYQGNRPVIGVNHPEGFEEGLSFSLREGEIAILQAPNGWGKTTLMEAITGVLPLTKGVIRLNSSPIQTLPIWDRAKLGVTFLQARNHAFPDLTVLEGFRLLRTKSKSNDSNLLKRRRMSELSGGEKQKIAIACLERKNTEVLLLDEPFSALDHKELMNSWELIMKTKKKTLLIAIPTMINGGEI